MALVNRSSTLGLMLFLTLAPSAQAERTMSCQDFRTALWRAIDAHGNKIARPELDKPAGGFGPSIGYRMTELDGLDGRLNCWKEQIYNFKAAPIFPLIRMKQRCACNGSQIWPPLRSVP